MAKQLFGSIQAQRLLLEYDDERSGSFAALRHVPNDKMVVLGLVNTKLPTLEEREDLEARIRAASEFVPAERLAISPQCGFSTSIVGNRITAVDQKSKLRLLVETAKSFWG